MPRCAVHRGGYDASGEKVQLKSALTIPLCSAAELLVTLDWPRSLSELRLLLLCETRRL